MTPDGRRARRDANRLLVLDAVLELFAEGVTNPSPEQVAARAGLSPRSVYRYVSSRDELRHAAIARQVEHLLPLLELPHLGEGSLETRVTALLRQRLALADAIARTNPVAKALALHDGVVAQTLRDKADVLRQQVANHFAPELAHVRTADRRPVLDAVDVLTQTDTVHYYRTVLGRSPEATLHSLRIALLALLERNPS